VCVPLRGREGAIGVLTLERLGEGRVFSDDEFELVQLFAAQASIALQNAEVHLAVRQRAQTDVLTGLLNHGTFVQHMDGLITAGEPFSLIMLDLDRFKPVNDLMGHQAGDLLLKQVAQAIVAASRDSDRVFRYGGDEFAVLLLDAMPKDVDIIVGRVRDKLAALAAQRRLPVAVECSTGIAWSHTPPDTAEEFLREADRDMHERKARETERRETA
jgi:diguanylate cyclase (GGDEF)-like protein